MVEITKEVKITNHREEVILTNLKTAKFIKIRKEAWDFLNRYISRKENKELLDSLKKEDKEKFFLFLEDLKKKDYLTDKSTPGCERNETSQKRSKSAFMNSERASYFEVTHKCNLRCKFCYVNPDYREEKIPEDIQTARSIIDRAREINIKKFIVTGGEPLLRSDIFDILTYAKKVMPQVVLTTNGILLKESTARKLKDSGVDVVSISIESSTKKIHDELRGEGSFEKSMNAIKNLKKAGFKKESLNITATLNRKNIHELNTFQKFADNLGVKMNFSLYQPVGRGKINDELDFTDEQLIRFLLDMIKAQIEDMHINVEDFVDGVTYNKIAGGIVPNLKNHCGMVAKLLGIKPNGDLVPCHMFFSSSDLKIGNILEEEILEKMWNFYINVPTTDEKEGCRDCNIRYFCGGSCYAGGYFCDGTFSTSNPSCRPLKKYYSAIIDSLGKKNETKYLFEKLDSYIH